MRKLILTATGLVCLVGVSYFIGTAAGENAAPPEPQRIALLDVGHIFNEYDKLKILKEELAAEAQEMEGQAKAKVQAIQALQQEMKTFNEGTPEFAKREKQLATLSSEFDTFRKIKKMEMLRKEAGALHSVYLEIQDAVDRLCEHNGITMVLRFDRSELTSSEPAKVNQALARSVVYFRTRDDLTLPVLKMLNTSYKKTTGGVEPASGVKKAPANSPSRQAKGQKRSTGDE